MLGQYMLLGQHESACIEKLINCCQTDTLSVSFETAIQYINLLFQESGLRGNTSEYPDLQLSQGTHPRALSYDD